jgi:hypothetical protein
MGKPENEQDYIRFMAEDIEVYLSKETWEGLDPKATELRFAIPGYGRFYLKFNSPALSGW